jgi:peptide/nickel transport system permease protein
MAVSARVPSAPARAAAPRQPAIGAGFVRLARRSMSVSVGAAIVGVLMLAAVLAPLIVPYDPYAMNPAERLQTPTASNVLGTDNYGRDLLTRLVYGARVSLIVGLASIAVAALIGVTVGLVSGYVGGWSDLLIMRLVEVVQAFPPLLLALALVSIMEVGVGSVILAVGLVQWTVFARVVRASALALKEEEFVLAARASGLTSPRIVLYHVLPNALAPLVVLATLGVGTAITTEAALSFLGLGVPPPTPSWGATLAFGLSYLRDSPHLATFPGLAIMVTVLGFNLLGDGLRDLGDPRLRRG